MYLCFPQRLQELVAVQGRIRQGTLPILRDAQLRKLVNDAGLDLDEDELQQVGFRNKIIVRHKSQMRSLYNESFLGKVLSNQQNFWLTNFKN